MERDRFDERPGRGRDTESFSGRGGGRGGRGGGKPTGAELRLKNKESRYIRESEKKRGGGGPSSKAMSKSTELSFRDDDGDDDGWVIADEKEGKKKKKASKRLPKSLKQRATEQKWVGNRSDAPSKPQ